MKSICVILFRWTSQISKGLKGRNVKARGKAKRRPGLPIRKPASPVRGCSRIRGKFLSLNDLSLFQTGLKSVAVGNSEPKLIHEIKKLSNVFQSPHPGLYGIIDGLSYYQKTELFSLDS